jgi:acyl-CoA thioester hydrolase
MFKSETIIRVRYAETDQMGFVYYGNYAQYYEVARVEALRSIGISYKSLEDSGIMMPVVKMSINYKKPAYYDDILRIVTKIKFIPTIKMEFLYEIYNSNDLLINSGETILVFVSKATMKPCQCPNWFINILEERN